MSVSISWKDSTRFAEFRTSRVGRKILSRALSKTAVTGKVEAKRLILQVYTISPGKIKLFTQRASTSNLASSIGASSVDPRGKRGIPLHEFRFTWKRGAKGKKYTKGSPPPLVAEIIRGQRQAWKGGFSMIGKASGKKIAIARRPDATRFDGVWNEKWSKTLIGPGVGVMLTNKRVVDPLFTKIADRLPVVLEQETRFAMDYERDKGSEAVTDGD